MISNATSAEFNINDVNVWGTCPAVWDDASFFWNIGASADFTLSVVGVPLLVAERVGAGDQVNLFVRNDGGPSVRYFQAVGIQSNFTVLATSSSPGTDFAFTVTGLDANTDYKFKAMFYASGTKNGQPNEVAGQRSASVYVIANSNTL